MAAVFYIFCSLLGLLGSSALVDGVHGMAGSSTQDHVPHLYDYIDPTQSPITLMDVLAQLENLDAMFNNSCSMDIMTFYSALTSSNPKMWAIKMFDSFGKPGSGLLYGGGQWPGSYSECRETVQENAISGRPFKGQYCWAYFTLTPGVVQMVFPEIHRSLTVKSAICVPNSCTVDQLLRIGKLLPEIFPSPIFNEYLNFTDLLCADDHVIWDNKTDTAILILTSFFAFFVLLCTGYDLWQRHITSRNQVETPENEETPKVTAGSIFLAFSAYSNGKKLFMLTGEKQCLPAVNGIRVISMMWIIVGHCCLVAIISIDNMKVFVDEARRWPVTIIRQGVLAVDTFFFLSGFLVAYGYLNEFDRTGGRISWLKFYVHRYVRLTPTYLLILWIVFGSLGKYMGEGPFWIRPFQEDSICKNYWWANILYINNFMPDDAQCMSHAWYIANDMQFYILCPLFLIPFTRSVRWSIFTAFLAIAATSGLSGYIGAKYDFPIAVDFDNSPPGSEEYNESFHVLYSKPYTRIGPYIVGLLTGWLIQRRNKITIPKVLVTIGWLISLTSMVTIVFIVGDMDALSFIVKAFYHTFARLVWAASIAWVVIACCNGYGGIVNTILSWSLWNPLSRLTFCTFLWHPASVFITLGRTETTTHFALMLLITVTVSNIIYAFGGAAFFSLLFEAPFVGLERCLSQRNSNYKRISKQNDRNA